MRNRLLTVPLILLLAAATAAQDAIDENEWQKELEKKLAKNISIDFQDKTLNKILDFFRDIGKLNVVLDRNAKDVAQKRLTLTLRNVKLESAIAWSCRLMGLEYVVKDEAVFIAKRNDVPIDWRGAMQERYRRKVAGGQEAWLMAMEARLGQKLKVDFMNDHLATVVQYLATRTNINIVLDWHLVGKDKRVKLHGEMTVRSALKWVARLADVKYAIRDEVIYVASKEALENLRLETGESSLSILFRRAVAFTFKKTPLTQAMDRLSRLSGVKIILRGLSEDDKTLVTASSEGVELNKAIRMVMKKINLQHAISFSGTSVLVVVSPRKARPTETKPTKEGKAGK